MIFQRINIMLFLMTKLKLLGVVFPMNCKVKEVNFLVTTISPSY